MPTEASTVGIAKSLTVRRECRRRERLVVLIAASGAVMAANLAVGPLMGSALFCAPDSDCGVLHAGSYASFLGLPTSAWGVLLYGAIGGAAWLGLPARRWLGAFLLAVVGTSTSMYLAYLALFVIGVWCAYCLVSAAVAATLLIALLRTRPRATARWWPLRPVSLAVLGSLTAAVTVVILAVVLGTRPGP